MKQLSMTSAEYRRFAATGALPGDKLVRDDAEKVRRPRRHLEDDLQRTCCDYLTLKGYLFAAIPNGGRRDLLEAVRMKRLGVVAGAPDLVVFLAGGEVVLLELKVGKNRLTPAQREFRRRARQLGHRYVEVRSIDDVVRALNASACEVEAEA